MLPAVQRSIDEWEQAKYWRRERAREFVASMKEAIDKALVPPTPAPASTGDSAGPEEPEESPSPPPVLTIKATLRRPRAP